MTRCRIVAWLVFIAVLCAGSPQLNAALQYLLPLDAHSFLPLLCSGIFFFWALEAGLPATCDSSLPGGPEPASPASFHQALAQICLPVLLRQGLLLATLPFALAIAHRTGSMNWQSGVHAGVLLFLLLPTLRFLADIMGRFYYLFIMLVFGVPQLVLWFTGQITLARTGRPAAHPWWDALWPFHLFRDGATHFAVSVSILAVLCGILLVLRCILIRRSAPTVTS